MHIYGLEKLSLVDYEGLCSAVVFTGGCNFLCPFCHNSGLVYRNVDMLDEAEVLEYLRGRSKMLDAVVVSGGEPTLQADLKDFVAKLKAMGYKVKLDTNGTNYEVLKDLVEEGLVDYVAMDIKNSLAEYPRTVGTKCVNIDNIRKCIAYLIEGHVEYEFRTTLVAQLHDTVSITDMAQDIKGAKVLYLQKFVDSDHNIKDGLTEVDEATAKQYQKILQGTVEKVKLRGYQEIDA